MCPYLYHNPGGRAREAREANPRCWQPVHPSRWAPASFTLRFDKKMLQCVSPSLFYCEWTTIFWDFLEISESEKVARLELQAKSMAEKMVREKVEEHKQKEIVKHWELEGLHNRAVSTLEHTKQEKQHLREENERLKQELRAVKIQLSKQPASYPNGHTLGTLSCVRYKVGVLRLPLSLYQRLSVDRLALVPLRVAFFAGYWL